MTAKVEAALDLTKWESNINKMIQSAGRADHAVRDMIGSMDKLETRIRAIAGQNLSLKVDLDVGGVTDFDDFIKKLTNQENQTLKLDVDVEESELQQLLRKLQGVDRSLSIDLDVDESDLESTRSALRSIADSLDINLDIDDSEISSVRAALTLLADSIDIALDIDDAELDTAKKKVDALDTNNPNIKVNVDDAEINQAGDKADKELESERTLPVSIDIDIGGALMDVANLLTTPITASIGTAVDLDTQVQRLKGTVAQDLPEVRDLIRELWTGAWGESQEEIADVIELAGQMRIPMDDLGTAVENAFQLVDIGVDDAELALRAMNTLILTGAAETWDEAGNLIAIGIRNGADRAEDFLDTLIEYTPQLAEFDMDGKAIVNALIGGLEAGMMDTDKGADIIHEFFLRATGEAGKDENIKAAFAQLGLAEAYESFIADELSGDELLSQTVTALKGVDNRALQTTLMETLFGSMAVDMGANIVTELNPAIDRVGVMTDALDIASEHVNNNLNTRLTAMNRKLQAAGGIISQEIAGGLLDVGDNLLGVFNDISNGLTEIAADVIRAFIDMFEDVPGFDTSGLEEKLADLSQINVEFALENEDNALELLDTIRQGLEDGVSETDIGIMLGERINEQLASGDVSGAAAFADFIRNNLDASNPLVSATMDHVAGDMADAAQTSIDEHLGNLDFQAALDSSLNDAQQGDTVAAIANWVTNIADITQADINEKFAMLDATSVLLDPMNGIVMTSELETHMREISSNMTFELINDFNVALAAGDFDLAQRIADDLNLAALNIELEKVKGEFQGVEDQSKDSTIKVRQELGKMGEGFKDTASESENMRDRSKSASQEMDTDIATAQSGIGISLLAMIANTVLTNVAMGLTSGIVHDKTADMIGDFDDMKLAIEDWRLHAVDDMMIYRDFWSDVVDSVQINNARLTESFRQTAVDIGNISIATPQIESGGTTNNDNSVTNNNNQQTTVTVNNPAGSAAVSVANDAAGFGFGNLAA